MCCVCVCCVRARATRARVVRGACARARVVRARMRAWCVRACAADAVSEADLREACSWPHSHDSHKRALSPLAPPRPFPPPSPPSHRLGTLSATLGPRQLRDCELSVCCGVVEYETDDGVAGCSERPLKLQTSKKSNLETWFVRHRIDSESPLNEERFEDLAFMTVALKVFDTAFMQEARAPGAAHILPTNRRPAPRATRGNHALMACCNVCVRACVCVRVCSCAQQARIYHSYTPFTDMERNTRFVPMKSWGIVKANPRGDRPGDCSRRIRQLHHTVDYSKLNETSSISEALSPPAAAAAVRHGAPEALSPPRAARHGAVAAK